MSLITSTLVSQTNPNASDPRNNPSLSTEITNLNTWSASLNDSVVQGYIREAGGSVAYATDSTFTIAGADRTSVYTQGRIVRFSDSTIALVKSSVFSTNTTVTIYSGIVPNPCTYVDFGIQPKGATSLEPDSNGANLIRNSNFINNSTNGYGGTPDNVSVTGTVVQGGFPVMSPTTVLNWTGVATANCMGMWTCNGNFNDQSSNGYNLTATNTPTDTATALMAQGKAFVRASSQYASILAASAPNLKPGSGSFTLISYFKVTALGIYQKLLSKTDTLSRGYDFFIGGADNKVYFNFYDGASRSINSDVIIETGKWYMAVAIRDTGSTKMRVFVNGIKKEGTGSNSAITYGSDNPFSMACSFDGAAETANSFLGGTLNGCAYYNVAFNDTQVRELFENTMYGGLKLNGSATATLSVMDGMDSALVGNATTVSINMYQDTASTGTIGILDSGTTTSATIATTGSWITPSVTRTIASDTSSISVKLTSASNNVWFRYAVYNQGSTALPFQPSEDDWTRFPRLLRMDFPAVVNGYSFEENKWFSYTPTLTVTGSTTYTGTSIQLAKYLIAGKLSFLNVRVSGTVGGTPSFELRFTTPIILGNSINTNDYFVQPISFYNSAYLVGKVYSNGSSNSYLVVSKSDYSNLATGTTYYSAVCNYEID